MENFNKCNDDIRIKEGRREIGKQAAVLLFGNDLFFNEIGEKLLVELGKMVEKLGLRGIENQKGSSGGKAH